ncbi:hypothetical protein SAMN05216198_1527 [Halopseudomonas litoralis]|uniref:Uncharacterized protein n=1 Tax=Halopseudomonas litoralis TaxID=797277 RepID=A0A1H1QMD5_9GAMM|nr:hypothetical protein SAMN05216198_1527 [Halopseudomonas litoralis]
MNKSRQEVIEETLKRSINEGMNVNPVMPQNILPKTPPKAPPSAPTSGAKKK